MIRRIKSKLGMVIGHDVNGKPLRAGDWVVILPRNDVRTKFRNMKTTIRGPAKERGKLEINEPMSPEDGDGFYFGSGEVFRRIKPRPNPGTWEEVTKLTGWTPEREKAPA